jgi:hypothetical protein
MPAPSPSMQPTGPSAGKGSAPRNLNCWSSASNIFIRTFAPISGRFGDYQLFLFCRAKRSNALAPSPSMENFRQMLVR